jgi:cell division GTPase FtsZ
MPVGDGFAMCNEVLRQAVEGISDLIVKPGTFGNIDFADIRTILTNSGTALMGIGIASGERRAQEAAQKAINSPLLDISINGAKGILFSITGGPDMTMHEMQEAAKIIYEVADKDAKIITGTTIDQDMKTGEIKVTVIATGFPNANRYSPGFSSREGFGIIKPQVSTNTQNINIEKKEEAPFRNFFSNKTTPTAVAKIVEKKPVIIEEKETAPEEDTPTEPEKPTPKNKNSDTQQKKGEIVADISEDDSDDWSSSIPSILRRNR